MTFLADDKEAMRNPLASKMGDLILPSQFAAIRDAARRAGVDEDAECLARLSCRTLDLSQRAATAFIEHLARLSQAQPETQQFTGESK